VVEFRHHKNVVVHDEPADYNSEYKIQHDAVLSLSANAHLPANLILFTILILVTMKLFDVGPYNDMVYCNYAYYEYNYHQ